MMGVEALRDLVVRKLEAAKSGGVAGRSAALVGLPQVSSASAALSQRSDYLAQLSFWRAMLSNTWPDKAQLHLSAGQCACLRYCPNYTLSCLDSMFAPADST